MTKLKLTISDSVVFCVDLEVAVQSILNAQPEAPFFGQLLFIFLPQFPPSILQGVPWTCVHHSHFLYLLEHSASTPWDWDTQAISGSKLGAIWKKIPG